MKITKVSQDCLDLIMQFEGFKPKPYLCPAKVPTIGFGSTRYADGTKVKLTDKEITRKEAVELLRDTLKQYELAVDAFCRDDIKQSQFDALVDFAYNCGVGNLKSSTLLKRVNTNQNDASIGIEFMKWTYANGKQLKGLIRRRDAEVKLYFK